MLPLPTEHKEHYPYSWGIYGKRMLTTSNPKETKILCTPGTETFIKLTRTFDSTNLLADKMDDNTQTRLPRLPASAILYIFDEHLNKTGAGDAVINRDKWSVGWIWERKGADGDFKLQIANGHNYQPVPFLGLVAAGNEITWGVLKAALEALIAYMAKDEIYGWTKCRFEIWDGPNRVGFARIVNMD
ncbi:MAG: hypothetical protein Q9169_001804 [Polycauliona sp. 2 TL-2023]